MKVNARSFSGFSAHRLERSGADVHFSTTTRSPIALEQALLFCDNKGLGIPKVLYTVVPGQFDRVLICSETPAAGRNPALLRALRSWWVEGQGSGHCDATGTEQFQTGGRRYRGVDLSTVRRADSVSQDA